MCTCLWLPPGGRLFTVLRLRRQWRRPSWQSRRRCRRGSCRAFAASSSSATARIATARYAAFFAPFSATVATGKPLGICTVASRASRPSMAPPFIGMPTTGRRWCWRQRHRPGVRPCRQRRNDAVALGTGAPGKRGGGLRCAVGRKNVRLIGHAEILQHRAGTFDHRPVTVRSP